MFPLIFGDGTENMTVTDSKGYSTSRDFLIGGQYFKADTQGDGYLLRSSRAGIIRFQKIFNSDDDNEDKVEKVDTFNGYSYAVVSSDVSGAKEFHLIKLDTDGSILYNEEVGKQATYTISTVE